MPTRGPPASASATNTAHSLSLLSEYTHTLDALPIELSRNFADLRELDAVLSSSMTSITAKIQRLTTLLEQGNAPSAPDAPRKEDRLWLLAEIAEEAARLKPGGEDKIRVAAQAADNLKAQALHMAALLDHVPGQDFDVAVLSRSTVYPHVATRNFVVPGMAYEGTRKRRAALSGQWNTNGAVDPSPVKRKRIGARDEEDSTYGPGGRSPRKEKTSERQARNGTRAKKNDRAASPAESLLSITSHLPNGSARLAAQNHAARAGSTASGTNKRSHSRNTALDGSANGTGAGDGGSGSARTGRGHGHANAHGGHQDALNPPATSHPSLPQPRGTGANGNANGNGDWLPAGPLEGPGVPAARGAAQSHPPMATSTSAALGLAAAAAAAAVEDGDDDPNAVEEADDRLYCFCGGPSYGDMIACDDDNCEKEWFHLPCIGLTGAPDGKWYCDTCAAKRNAARRGGRGGKRKTGGRAGAKGDK